MTPLTPSQLSALEPLLEEYVAVVAVPIEERNEYHAQWDRSVSYELRKALGGWLEHRLASLALHLIEENRRLREGVQPK